MYLWNHGIKPFEKETEKSSPVKAGTEKLEDTKPEDSKPEGIKQKPIRSNPFEIDSVDIKPKVNIEAIKIEPWKQQIEIQLDNEGNAKGPTVTQYRSENDKVEAILDEAKELLGEEYNLERNSAKLDLNILIFLDETGNKDVLYKYIKTVCGKNKEKLPFELAYDLEGISNLDKEERKNLKKITTRDKKLGAIINKERFFDIIKARLAAGKRLLLPAPSKYKKKKVTKKMMRDANNNSKYKHEEPKTRIVDKLKARLPKPGKHEKHTNIISKVKSVAISLGRETLGGLKIIGTKLSGHFKKENTLVIENKERSIRDLYFFGEVDHEEAQQKAEEASIKSKGMSAPIK